MWGRVYGRAAKAEKNDPYAQHVALLDEYADKNMHRVIIDKAYLAGLLREPRRCLADVQRPLLAAFIRQPEEHQRCQRQFAEAWAGYRAARRKTILPRVPTVKSANFGFASGVSSDPRGIGVTARSPPEAVIILANF